MHCGLLGRKLDYSLSKQIHEAYGLYDYSLIEKEPQELDGFFEFFKNSDELSGINVTIPYKESVIKYCDELSESAKRIGAVNCIYKQGAKLIGSNTDYYGFLKTLNKVNARPAKKTVLILGRGGAAKCVAQVMREKHAAKVILTGRSDFNDLSQFCDAEIIVNATPVGTAKTELEGRSLADLRKFPKAELVIDLVYNPKITPLLKQAKELGIANTGGMFMLNAQAEKAARLFMKTQNIALVGMPGCGKSHIGRVLAKKSGRSFADTDSFVKEMTGKYPADIIKEKGEKYFRSVERDALKELISGENLIIACGGGIVTDEKSRRLLEECFVILIERRLELLSTRNRPLSKDVYKLYNDRIGFYEEVCDIAVENNKTADDCVSEIRKVCRL